MERIRTYMTSCCISYTLTLLIQATFFGRTEFFFNGFTSAYLLQLFAVCVLISVLMYMTDQKKTEQSCWKHMAIQLADVFVGVFGMGGLCFRWFPWEVRQIAVVGGFVTVIYAATYGATLLYYRMISMEINEKLASQNRHRREKQ